MAREISVRRLAAAIALAPALLAAPTASAQSGLGQIETGEAAGRYQIVRIDGVVARLDTATGRLAPCRVVGETIDCGDDGTSSAAPSDARGGSALTGSDETDIAIERMQKLFRGFADIVKELDDDRRDDGGANGPEPGRT
ncbi:hypothetical protein [Jiella pacifica]|uniref:Uncharacterized protein n=1 Tax=Jiella pacifica TaxID=2696469 RepID=A0A6N9SY58_9HYPH|nr:hypothetical protein [Jiella pacifica]NDW03957.1 hypothetical protein [Jiella pacifica]